jgi:hypothetical protein
MIKLKKDVSGALKRAIDFRSLGEQSGRIAFGNQIVSASSRNSYRSMNLYGFLSEGPHSKSKTEANKRHQVA